MVYIKYLLLNVFAFLFCCMYAQTESITIKDSVFMTCAQCDSLYNRICPPNIFGHPENLEEFPGGVIELMNFLRNNLQYPKECKEKAIQGRVIVKFIINESGKIICPYIYKSLHPALDKEALRIVKLMPDWKPASNNKVPCKACYTLPIIFKL
jgi:TonB family protein